MTRRSRALAAQLVAVLAGAVLSRAQTDPLWQARRQFAAGEYRAAAGLLRAAIERDGSNAALCHWLARCYFELGDFERAVASAERSVDLVADNSDYHQWLGRAIGRKAERSGPLSAFGLARRARREFELAVRLDPANLSAQRDLIDFYLQAPGIVGGGRGKAEEQIETLAALDAAEGHLARAAYWREGHEIAKAEAEVRRVLEAMPPCAGPYLGVADFYEDRRDPVGMAEAVGAAAAVDPSDPRLGYYRGVVAALSPDRGADAEEQLETYLHTVPESSDFPSRASALEWLGWLVEQQGRRSEAAEHYRGALRLEPGRETARRALRRLEH